MISFDKKTTYANNIMHTMAHRIKHRQTIDFTRTSRLISLLSYSNPSTWPVKSGDQETISLYNYNLIDKHETTLCPEKVSPLKILQQQVL